MAETPTPAPPAPAQAPKMKDEPGITPDLEATPLERFVKALPDLVEEAGYDEVWNVQLSCQIPCPVGVRNVLRKYLRANGNDFDKAAAQLSATLKWRRDFNPLGAMQETFELSKFDGLGYVTESDNKAEGGDAKSSVITWNIYGAVKDNKATFGDVDKFLRWRVGLMEKALWRLKLSEAYAGEIPDDGAGPDPYQVVQVHDYLSVSFLRMDPTVKACSTAAISLFQNHYPELLSRKFFVNVPVIMGWLFNTMKVFMAEETKRKMVVLSYGNQVASELGWGVPKEYGGEDGELKSVGESMKLA